MTGGDAFAGSRERFAEITEWLDGPGAAGLTHASLEDALQARGRELLRQLYQDYLDLRAAAEQRLPQVSGADGAARRAAEPGHARALGTVFGQVTVRRIAYRKPGHPNLHPADGQLNLPREKHSHGLRRLAAAESARGSFGSAVTAIERTTGQRIGKRQAEQLARAAAADFNAFYARRRPPPAASAAGDLLVLSSDGKGVLMRPAALRPRAAAVAARAAPKLATRLSQGEVRTRKRIATVGAVYDAAPAPRTPADILPPAGAPHRPGPAARGKWLTVSITADRVTVIADTFSEARRRDPGHARTWIALVDGDPHQISQIQAQASACHAHVPILIDFVHVLEYLWRAAWTFHPAADPAAETWVAAHARAILAGHATQVAAAITRQANTTPLTPARSAGARACARYLTNKNPYLDYPTALARGWPIATGIIEGACRHLVKDRMDITGARWCLDTAEAILKLRALTTNNDFDAYWAYHLTQEQHRVHQTRYPRNHIPQAA